MKKRSLIPLAVSAALLAGCGGLGGLGSSGSSTRSTMEQAIGAQDKVALLPIANFTDVPQAGLRVRVCAGERELAAQLHRFGHAGPEEHHLRAGANYELLFS